MAAPVYSLDTNVFMDWQARFDPTDVFQTLEQRIEQMVGSGGCLAVDLVRELGVHCVKTDDRRGGIETA